MEERRKFKRFEFREPVGFSLKSPDQFNGCLSADISASGIRLNFVDFIPLNSEVMLKVPLAPNQILDCNGHVVWVEKMPFMDRYQAGIELDDDQHFFEFKRNFSQIFSD